MSSNVGLSTPRGSGTSGYIQRNLSALKPRDTGFGAPYPPLPRNSSPSSPRPLRQPDQAILIHDRQRQVEVQVFELRDSLEDEGKLDEDEIEKRCEELRIRLLEEMEGGKGGRRGKGVQGKGLKPHQVHELAEAKIMESERLRKALGIKEGREGKVWEDNDIGKEESRNRDREREPERNMKKEDQD